MSQPQFNSLLLTHKRLIIVVEWENGACHHFPPFSHFLQLSDFIGQFTSGLHFQLSRFLGQFTSFCLSLVF